MMPPHGFDLTLVVITVLFTRTTCLINIAHYVAKVIYLFIKLLILINFVNIED